MTARRVAPPRAVAWSPNGQAIRIIDQRRLPSAFVECDLTTVDAVADSISTLAVRGAPAIGVCAALGLAMGAQAYVRLDRTACDAAIRADAATLRATRPTAVNLPWALDRMLACLSRTSGTAAEVAQALRDDATRVLEEDRAMCQAIGAHGAPLLADVRTVLTHCNAGALATAGIGTALAPVYVAAESGQHLHVYADETRPLWQGARLTAWELQRAGIDVTVITDGMTASMMRAGLVDVVLTGADRICANGDVVNKVGTYGVAVLAQHHGIPFYVAAPWSTMDATTPAGDAVLIEERHREEVAAPYGIRVVPDEVAVRNPAFDVTPSALVTAIITDRGVHRPPYHF